MKINKETQKFFSVASKPGNFGATVYNALFQRFGINAIYVPLHIDPKHNFSQVLHGLEIIGARGVNVSMPFKQKASQLLHGTESVVVNTLVRDKTAEWKGHDTDTVGFMAALQRVAYLEDIESIHIYGTGAIAGLVAKALCAPGRQITVSKDPVPVAPVDLFVNATPVGMEGVEEKFSWQDTVSQADCVFDVVISPPKKITSLIAVAQEKRKRCVAGQSMCMHGLAKQFLLHQPGEWPVEAAIREEMQSMGYDNV